MYISNSSYVYVGLTHRNPGVPQMETEHTTCIFGAPEICVGCPSNSCRKYILKCITRSSNPKPHPPPASKPPQNDPPSLYITAYILPDPPSPPPPDPSPGAPMLLEAHGGWVGVFRLHRRKSSGRTMNECRDNIENVISTFVHC